MTSLVMSMTALMWSIRLVTNGHLREHRDRCRVQEGMESCEAGAGKDIEVSKWVHALILSNKYMWAVDP